MEDFFQGASMASMELSPEERFTRYHDRLRNELNIAYTHHAISKTLKKSFKDHRDEINIAPTFFGLTIDAHLFSTILSVSRFVDAHSKAFKIKKFFDLIEENFDALFSDLAYEKHLRQKGYDDEDTKYWMQNRIKITRETIVKDKDTISKLPIENLKSWRDKKLAHIDEYYVLTNAKISEENPITSIDIDKIIDTLHDILNRYLLAYDGSEWVIGVPASGVTDQIEYILDSIKFRRNQDLKDINPLR